jgi:hypothetical protein
MENGKSTTENVMKPTEFHEELLLTNEQWDPNYISKVHNTLFISGFAPAHDRVIIEHHGSIHNINMTRHKFGKRSFPISGYMQIDIRDAPWERMYPYFSKITTFISNAHKKGVRC